MTEPGRNVILFSTADWDNPFWTNKQHTAVQLAELGYRVLYIESLGLRQPQLKKTDLSRMLRRIFKFLRGARKVRNNLYVYSPLVIPFHRFALIRLLNQIFLKVCLRGLQWRLQLQSPLIWTYNPMILDLAKALHGSQLVYHSVDDLSASPGVDRESILRHEDELLKNADAVFCTSRKLEARCKIIAGERVHYFGNVVDFDHFSKARTDLPEPADLTTIPHPRIGFVGAMSAYKVDVENILKVSRSRPDWHWIMIGKVGEGQPDSKMDELRQIANIHFLGPRPYESLPSYLRAFDVAVIPCTVNDYTQAMFPMKFFEYMAAGKPIVARRIDSLKDYSEDYYPYDTALGLESQLVAALEHGVKRPHEALLLAQENTWSKRLAKMLAILNSPGIK